MNEREVRQLMSTTVVDIPPDTVDLEAAIRRGRLLRRRMRARQGLGITLVAVTVAAGGLFVARPGTDPSRGSTRPAAVPLDTGPAYTGPASLPMTRWQKAVGGLLPGTIVASSPVETPAPDDDIVVGTAFRLERGGRTSIVRVTVMLLASGAPGIEACTMDRTDCSPAVKSSVAAGATVQAFDLGVESDHENGRGAVLVRPVRRRPAVGGRPAIVAVRVTAVAGDLGPGEDGWAVGMTVPAQPGLSKPELLAYVQSIPLPSEALTRAVPQP